MAGIPKSGEGSGLAADRRRGLSSARLAAVQAIYQLDMAGGTAEQVVPEFLRHRGGAAFDEGEEGVAADHALFADLVGGVARERATLDGLIGKHLAEAWPLQRLEKVMAATLRAGAYELMRRPEVPARVVINEYVDVAHAFLGEREVGMVNGVLDRLARVLRGAEMGEAGGGEG